MTIKQRLYRFRSELRTTSKYTGNFLFFVFHSGLFNVILLYYLVRFRRIKVRSYARLVKDLGITQDVSLGLYLYERKFTYEEMKRAVLAEESDTARKQRELLERAFFDGE